jgi:cyclopropane fatty-acyl-phospholipid synthase-like methyltransferase
VSQRIVTIVGALVGCCAAWAASAQSWAPKRPDVVFVPTPQKVVDAMLRLATVTSADVVYDLGSGDGRIPITAAITHGAYGVGIDVDPGRIRESNENARRAGVAGRVQFRQQDAFDTDVRDATVVTLFLLPWMNMRLMPRLQLELRPGARIVSHHFLMGDQWPPDRAQDVDGLMIYLWTIKPPAKSPAPLPDAAR